MDAPKVAAMVALGVSRARQGVLVKASLVLGALMIVGAVLLGALLGRGSHDPAELARLPITAAGAIAWAAGVLVAFSASSQALVRDRREGIVELLASRGVGALAYVLARCAGLALVLFALSALGCLGAAAGELVTARSGALDVLRGIPGGLAFSLMFSLSVAPLALAVLGARGRAGGYFALLLVLGLPELFVKYTDALLPDGWGELAAVPSALGALATAVSPQQLDPALGLRAACVLLVVAAGSIAAVRAQLARAEELAS